jgi:hypothetical protein
LLKLLVFFLQLRLEFVILLFEVGDVGIGALEGDVLHENGLGEDVKRVGVCAELLAEKILGVGVFFLELGLIDTLRELGQELLFLGSHDGSILLARAFSGRCLCGPSLWI